MTFPTAVFITLHDGREERVTLAEGLSHGLHLNQIADIYLLCNAAEHPEVTPREGLDRLAAILAKVGGLGPTGIVMGHSILSIGLAMLLLPSLANLAGAALLGLIMLLFKLVNRDRPVLAVPTPVFAATLVSTLTYWPCSTDYRRIHSTCWCRLW